MGWFGLAAYIALYDSWALATRRETLTTVFHRSMKHPLHRWPVMAVCVLTVLHLFGWLPVGLDPFHYYSVGLARLLG